MKKLLRNIKEYFNQLEIARYDAKVEQHIAEMNKGSLMIEGDRAFRWTRVSTGKLFWKTNKLVKVYE